MHVLVAKMTFHLEGMGSLKDKRRLRQAVIERLRQRFGVSVAEVAHADSTDLLTIGMAIVGSQRVTLQATMQRGISFASGVLGDASDMCVEFR